MEGIEARVALMPVLPFLEDSWASISDIVETARACGVRTIVPAFGVTMRDRQRAYFYRQLDERFPGLRARYEARYGERYECPVPDTESLSARFHALCDRYGIRTAVRSSLAPTSSELPLFGEGAAR